MIKNYTSSVPVDRTISKIEAILVICGATNIVKDYRDGKLHAICFAVFLPNERKIVIRLPVYTEGVYNILAKKVKKPRKGTQDKIKVQAERTAWKLMQDWVEVQLSLISMNQADLLQVFLPYIWDGRQTYYARIADGGFKQLSMSNE